MSIEPKTKRGDTLYHAVISIALGLIVLSGLVKVLCFIFIDR